MNMELPVSVSIGDAVLCQQIQEEAVLLNMETQQYYGLNPTASTMWNQLIELQSVQATEARLCELFEAPPEVMRADLHNLVAELVSHGLLTPCNIR